MKKIFLSLISFVLLFALVSAFALNISAEQSEEASSESVKPNSEFVIPEDPDEIILTAARLEEIKEQLKQEILAELSKNNPEEENGDASAQNYHDVTLKEGQMILLTSDSEVIFRGGSAIAVTSACSENEGIWDLSQRCEIFSGEALKSGHIYVPGESFSKKVILITGQSAYFTLRGSYEIV